MNRKRYAVLDAIRGVALLNMIVYHALWDLVFLFGFDLQWYRSEAIYIWQQIICCTFICLSGFCQPLGKQRLKRGVTVYLAGLAVSATTMSVTPENPIIMGILTLIGTCMLLTVLLEPLLKRCRPVIGLIVSTALFFLTRNIGNGYLGVSSLELLKLPDSWYCNIVTAYLGLPPEDFYSADYFPIIPWIFLFAAGYFLFLLLGSKDFMYSLEHSRIRPIEWCGRRSLGIYVIHQPVLYLTFTIIL